MESPLSTRSYEDYGTPTDGRVALKGASPRSPRLFEVRSVQNLLSSSDSVGDLQKGPKSPSRSLFDLPKQGEPQTKPGYYSPSRRDDGSAQKKRQVSGGREGVPPSPRREQIRRVVLELDDLEL